MSSKPKIVEFQTALAQPTSEETRTQESFERQRAYFATDVTKTYDWRVDQLDRLIRMLKENYGDFANASREDFKTASSPEAWVWERS